MHKIQLMIAATAALSLAAPAHAGVVVNYTFGATGSGTMTLDQTGSTYTLSALNLTLGSANFTTANSALNPCSTTSCLLGSTYGGGPGFAQSGQNTFFFFFDPNLSSQSGSSFAWSQTNDAIVHDEADSITITRVVPGAVPEPATWAMMLVGFGAIGFTLRRRSAAGTPQVT